MLFSLLLFLNNFILTRYLIHLKKLYLHFFKITSHFSIITISNKICKLKTRHFTGFSQNFIRFLKNKKTLRGSHEIHLYLRKPSISCIQRSCLFQSGIYELDVFSLIFARATYRLFRSRWHTKSINENFVHLLHVDYKIRQEIVRRWILMHAGKETYRSLA